MTSRGKKILTVVLATNKPTPLKFADVYTWVIWQFPRYNGSWLCGAIRPPLAGHHWLPALINPRTEQLMVCGHVEEAFATPEAAAEHCRYLRLEDEGKAK